MSWEEDIQKFIILTNSGAPNLPELIEKDATILHNKYPERIEPLFYLLRAYRIKGNSDMAWCILDKIDKSESKLIGQNKMYDEILFEKSIIYNLKKGAIQALRYSVDYLNIDDCGNWEYVYENLHYLCEPLIKQKNTKLYKLDLPELGKYHPSSISHVRYNDDDCLCVRYVNYKINPRNQIYDCTEFSSSNMLIYRGSRDIVVNNFNLPKYNTPYRGIEDCRLYVDVSNNLRFIGTQQEYVPGEQGINLMIDGKVDLDTFSFTDGRVLSPPIKDSLCEKNWIPWLSPGGVMNFIYWWYPFQVGRLDEKNTLQFVVEQEVPGFFKSFRGSTCLVPWKEEYCALVHFVHTPLSGEGTRRYYHCMIFMEIRNDLPWVTDFTLPFTFLTGKDDLHRGAIEYCMGFDIKNNSTAHLWVSHLDSNPHKIEIPMQYFESIRYSVVKEKGELGNLNI